MVMQRRTGLQLYSPDVIFMFFLLSLKNEIQKLQSQIKM